MVQMYVPTEDSSNEDKDAYYEMLPAVVSELPKHDIKIITGDIQCKSWKRKYRCKRYHGNTWNGKPKQQWRKTGQSL